MTPPHPGDSGQLSSADVSRLLQDPSAENRASAATKVASTFSDVPLTDRERSIVEDIFKVMVKDAEVRVRKALSENLKDNPELPHDIAVSLAKDVDEVALPLIESSKVLNEKDLIELVETRGESVQVAVAGRGDVTENVSEAIADSASEAAVATLVGNEQAQIAEHTFSKVLDKYEHSDAVTKPMAEREELPLAVAEKLVAVVSDNLQQEIMKRHNLSKTVVEDLAIASREKATVSLLSGREKTVTLQEFVDQLYDNKRLTPTLVVRALCMGDVDFFESAVAKLAGIPVLNAYKVIHQGGDTGLIKLYKAAGIPAELLHISMAALEIVEEARNDAGENRDMFKQLMIERVLTRVEDAVDTENLDYLINRLART